MFISSKRSAGVLLMVSVLAMPGVFGCADSSENGATASATYEQSEDGALDVEMYGCGSGKFGPVETLSLEILGGELVVAHTAEYRGCAWDPIITGEFVGGAIRIVEGFAWQGAQAGCMCAYDYIYRIPGAQAGVYSLVYRELEQGAEASELRCEMEQTVDLTGDDPVVLMMESLGC